MDVGYYNIGFGPAHQQFAAFVAWIPLQVAALLVYPLFKVKQGGCNTSFIFHLLQLWGALHLSLGLGADVVFLVLFVLYNVAAHAVVVSTIVNFDLPPVPALVLSVEEVRV